MDAHADEVLCAGLLVEAHQVSGSHLAAFQLLTRSL